MDEGLPVAYEVLERGVPVYASDGTLVGSVEQVLAVPREDIFHGIVLRDSGGALRVAEAAQIGELHERGVDLRIDGAAAALLPTPRSEAPVYRVDPGELKGWHHWVHRLRAGGDWQRER